MSLKTLQKLIKRLFIFCVQCLSAINISLLLRVGVATVFLIAGIGKCFSPTSEFVAGIGAYKIFPPALFPIVTPIIAAILPPAEIFLAVNLLITRQQKITTALLGTLTIIFTLVLFQAKLRGLNLEGCACALGETDITTSILRNVVILIALYVSWKIRYYRFNLLKSIKAICIRTIMYV
jgi:uncharacterized membrane protein YphA (DoxX/SURF4 family)